VIDKCKSPNCHRRQNRISLYCDICYNSLPYQLKQLDRIKHHEEVATQARITELIVSWINSKVIDKDFWGRLGDLFAELKRKHSL